MQLNPEVLSAQTSVWPVTFVASFLIWIMFFGLFILWIIDGKTRKEISLHAFYSVVFAWIIAKMVKEFFPTARPFITNGDPVLTFTTMHADASFPSVHTTVAFALAMTVWFHNKKVGVLFLLAAVAVAVGRVVSNVHYPRDVFAGALLGFVISFATSKLHVSFSKHKKSNLTSGS